MGESLPTSELAAELADGETVSLTTAQFLGLVSSASHEWATPQQVFDALDREFHFTMDAAASSLNAKCQHFFTADTLTLMMPWDGVVFCNPPYGREIGKWIQKGYDEALRGVTTVLLLPARTDTRWFHELCLHGEIRFIKGRLRFNNHRHNAPFPSMLVIFRP